MALSCRAPGIAFRAASAPCRALSAYGRVGEPVSLMAMGDELKALKTMIASQPQGHAETVLTERQACDVELILTGGMSPLTGFMTKAEYELVLREGKLITSGLPWTVPITMDVTEDTAKKAEQTHQLALRDEEGRLIAVMSVQDVWRPDKDTECLCMYGSSDLTHPSVRYLKERVKNWCVGGQLRGVQLPVRYDFGHLRNTPTALRSLLSTSHSDTKGKDTKEGRVVAVVTSHSPIAPVTQALSRMVSEDDRLLLLPAASSSSSYGAGGGEVASRVRIRAWELAHVDLSPIPLLSLVPYSSRHSTADREAIMQAVIARNYGADHLALMPEPHVDMTSAYDAVRQLVDVTGIHPVMIGNDSVTAAAISAAHSSLVRGCAPNNTVADVVSSAAAADLLARKLPPKHRRGLCLFFTGLSGSGKSTLANAVAQQLEAEGGRSAVIVLDGDVVRHNLSKGLGFSKDHRDLNILRIGYVASLIVQCGGVALCAPIAPYADIRQRVRETVAAASPLGHQDAFVEIHVATPLHECESRDTKARRGLLKHFTGIDDPYEAPERPEIRIDTQGRTVEECVDDIMAYLRAENYLAPN